MTDLVIDLALSSRLERLRQQLPQGLLLSGDHGVGLRTIAQTLHPNIEHRLAPTDSKGNPDTGGSIGIEAIRELYTLTRGRSTRPVGVLIDDADRMTLPAQQAFLKLLEEPPEAVSFILTSHRPDTLLRTIRSRVTQQTVPRVSRTASTSFLGARGIGGAVASQLLFIADGRPALLHRLATDEAYRETAIAEVKQARTFLQGTPYERAAIAVRTTDRAAALRLLDTTLQLLDFSLRQAPASDLSAQIDRLMAAHTAIAANAQPRLQLLRTVVY